MKRNKILFLFAWIVAIVATSGSLYLSEVLLLNPCKLCWYQRIMMYPLVILLGIAFFKKDFKMKFYVLPMSIIGMGVATYHVLLQKYPHIFSTTTTCDPNNPCTTVHLDPWVHLFTVPALSLIAFTFITIALFFVKTKKED